MPQTVKVLDPRTDLNQPLNWVIEDGARLVNFQVTNTSSVGGGGSSLTFSNADPPGPGVVIDKKIILGITYKLTFTRTPALNDPVIGFEALPGYSFPTDHIRALGSDAPRFLPIAQTTNSVTVMINSAAASANVYEFVEPLMRYNLYRDYFETQLSLAPSYQDQYQQYSDYLLFGSARNALGDYGENGYQSLRGGHPLIWVQQNELGDGTNPKTAIVYLTSYEPIFVSPLDFGMANERGFVGVETFRVTLNTVGDLNRVWSHDSAVSTFTSVSTSIVGASDAITYSNGITTSNPAIYFTYLTPKLLQDIPSFNAYPYHWIDNQNFPGGTLGPGGYVQNKPINSFKLASIPKYLYIFVREVNENRNLYSTDTYAYISNISVTFANSNNLVNSANPIQLYEIAAKNGCNLSWVQWSKQVGSVLCLDFSQDIGLPDDMFVGLRDANIQLKLNITYYNLSAASKDYTIYTLPVYTGVFDITSGQASTQSGLVTLPEYLAAKDIHTVAYEQARNYYGGNFFSNLKSAATKALPYIKDAAKIGAKYLPEATKYLAPLVAPRIAPELQKGAELIARLVGSGYTQAQAKKMVKDGSYKRLMRGGQLAPANQMRSTLLDRAVNGY